VAGLDNFRTLCIACHHDVTLELRQRRGKEKAQARQGNVSQEEAVLEEGEEEEGEEEEEVEEEESISSQSSSLGAPRASEKAGVGAGDEGLIVIDEETETEDEA
jgi:transcriptional antiterminator Rof (Rho-off)